MKNGLIEVPLFIGLTRPAMFNGLGIPLKAFVIEFVATAFTFGVTGNPFAILSIIPYHAFIYYVSSKDVGMFHDFWLALLTSDGNGVMRKLWGCRSFGPIRKNYGSVKS